MPLTLFQVDAFSAELFKGNPAAVVPLDTWLPEQTLQNIAAENNLAETAFFVPRADHSDHSFEIRWFTPTEEVPLCGHATLASAFVLFDQLGLEQSAISFHSISGELKVRKAEEGFLELDFPALPYASSAVPEAIANGLSIPPAQVLRVEDDPNYFAVYETASDVLQVVPDLALLATLHPYGVVVTAPGTESDCISRYFLPSFGIPEDPVTGSIHCVLTPYWAERLGKTKIHAKQASPRGGELFCEIHGSRVRIKGQCQLYLSGTIFL